MADDENQEEAIDTSIPEVWKFAKPPAPEGNEDEPTPQQQATGPRVGKLIKFLNDLEEQEEFEAKIQEPDPATGQSLLTWATITNKFVVVEWLVKKGKRAAFSFRDNNKELMVYDKWIEIRKELEEKEKERLENPPEEEEAGEDDEEKVPEPTADQLVYEALSEFHEEWGARGQGFVKLIGELGVYQGSRDETGAKKGLGQTLFPNGDMYTGEYLDNTRHGHGTYFFNSDGVIFTGQWSNNLRHGIGRCVYPDGGRYLGSWVNDKRHGEGRFTYPDGSSYIGSWVNDTKHGYGTMTFVDGSVYAGTFQEGDFVSGEWRLCGSTRYYGSFQDGAPAGKGVYVFKHGKEGSYVQEGEYVSGVWIPGESAPADAQSKITIRVQNNALPLSFTPECCSLRTEHLVAVTNFLPFQEWVARMNASKRHFVDAVRVAGVVFDAAKDVEEVRLKLQISDIDGNRLRNTDAIVLRKPVTRMLAILVGGDKQLAVLEEKPSAAMLTAEHLSLPQVHVCADGTIMGTSADTLNKILRVNINKSNTISVGGTYHTNLAESNSATRVLVYIQQLHADTIATLQAHLDARRGAKQVDKLRAVRLSEVPNLSTDAVSIITAHNIISMIRNGALPAATTAKERPATPIPPQPEPRPDIEPLLEAERNERNKKVVVAEDE